MRRDPSRGLGRTQRLVLHLLADRPKSVRTLLLDWWPRMPESSIRSALYSLGRRSLVDAAGWEPNGGRTYALTDKGREVERELVATEEPGEYDV